MLTALGSLFAEAASGPGTSTYTLHLDLDDADGVWFYEAFADESTLKAHSESSTIKEVVAALRPILGEAPRITRVQVERSI